MSGGSTISGGGGTNNNNNNKKKSPGTGFPLSSQVPVSTTLLSSVGVLNYMLSEQDGGQIANQSPNHAKAMHAITFECGMHIVSLKKGSCVAISR